MLRSIAFLAAFLLLVQVAGARSLQSSNAVAVPQPMNILGAIRNEGSTNLISSVISANPDFSNALSKEGPFTVFAPTDKAVAAVEELLTEDPDLVDSILAYHVVPVRTNSLSDGQQLIASNGLILNMSVNSTGVFVNDAEIVMAFIETSNGVVHVIDKVLMPPSTTEEVVHEETAPVKLPEIGARSVPPTVVDVAENAGFVNTIQAISDTGFAGVLNDAGPFTVFAPVDEAVADLLSMDLQDLNFTLAYHVVRGNYLSTNFNDGQQLMSMNGYPLDVTVNSTGIFLNGIAQIKGPDNVAGNGVVHVITQVLTPPHPADEMASREISIQSAVVPETGVDTTAATSGGDEATDAVEETDDAAVEETTEESVDEIAKVPANSTGFCSWSKCDAPGAKPYKNKYCNKSKNNCEEVCQSNWCLLAEV